jgi:hypothetical protein
MGRVQRLAGKISIILSFVVVFVSQPTVRSGSISPSIYQSLGLVSDTPLLFSDGRSWFDHS